MSNRVIETCAACGDEFDRHNKASRAKWCPACATTRDINRKRADWRRYAAKRRARARAAKEA